MSFEKSIFEKKGLVLDKERVLTYSKLSCPLECRYCFVDDLSSSEQQQGVAYLSQEQRDAMRNLPDSITLVMLGCDTEFFQNREDALETLEFLSGLGKDISVITKFALPKNLLESIAGISEQLKLTGNRFSLSVSIPCYESAEVWEPVVPSPERRVQTLHEAADLGIDVLVAVRPLIPTLDDSELERIIHETKDVAAGYYSGPMYLKELDPVLVPEDMRGGLSIEKMQPHWMPEGNDFYKIEKPGQMDRLKELVAENGKVLFDGAADANKFLK